MQILTKEDVFHWQIWQQQLTREFSLPAVSEILSSLGEDEASEWVPVTYSVENSTKTPAKYESRIT